jgi:tetratricopeptide (TPR) repeat protein
MTHSKPQKTIKAAIPFTSFKVDLDKFFQEPTDLELRKQVLSTFFQISDSHIHAIKISKNEETVNFFWQIPKIIEEAEKHHKNAISLAKNRQLLESIKEWQLAAEIDPYNPEYQFHLGVAYYETKKFDEAIRCLERALSICPILQRAYLILGMSYLKTRKFDQAKSYLEKSLNFTKSNLLIYLNLGSVYGILKEYDKAEEMFMKSISLAPKEPRPYFGLAKIYSTLGKNEEANNFFKKVIELDTKGTLANYAKRSIVITQKSPVADAEIPEEIAVKSDQNPEEFYTRGYRQFLLGNFQQAIKMYQHYLKIKPTDDYVWYALGEAQLRVGDVQNAVESFKRAAKISPQKGLYYKEMAIGFYYLKDWEKLAAAAKKAKDLGKNDSLVYCLLGIAQAELGNINESIVLLDSSLKKNSNNLLAKYFIAQSLLKRHEPEDAIVYLEEIIASKVNSPLKPKAEKLLKQIESM